MNSLNEIFEHILHSEERFSKRINRLRELGVRLQDCQRELHHARSQGGALKGELVLKNQKLADCEVSRRLQEVKKNVLEEQRAELIRERQQLTENLEQTLSNGEQKREEFFSEVKEFNRSYDLTGAGVQYREEQAKRKVSILEEELEFLETERSEIQIQQEEVKKLEQQLVAVTKRLDVDNNQQRELKVTLQDIQAVVAQLEEENTCLTVNLSKDTEFIRLQREIEACRNSSEEAECHQLTKELENLQRMSYQKQMKYHSISRTAKKGMNRSPIHHSDCRNLHSSQADNDHQNSILEERRVTPLEQTSHTSGVTMADCEGETHKRSRCERAENSSSVKKRVADGEWLTGDQDECEDWELEALAEASELTTLDLSGDDDSNVCIIDKEEEEEKITTYHDRTGDSNLLKWLSPCGQATAARVAANGTRHANERARSDSQSGLVCPNLSKTRLGSLTELQSEESPHQSTTVTRAKLFKPTKRVRFHY